MDLLSAEEPDKFGRRLLGCGARAFPPDDCESFDGYEECIKVATGKLKNRDRLQWLNEIHPGWHPEKFDFRETEKLYYQAKLFPRAHYEEGI